MKFINAQEWCCDPNHVAFSRVALGVELILVTLRET